MKRFFILLSVIAFSFSAHAAEVKEVISKHGIKAWLVEEHSLPLVAMRVVFTGAGTASDPVGKESRAYLASGLFNEGAGDKDAIQFKTAIEDKAIQLSFNADEDMLVASMDTLSDHKDTAFSLLGEALASPRFERDAVERVRSQVQSALSRALDRPGTLAVNALNSALFGNHPYGRPVIGTKKSIDSVTADDLKRYVKSYVTRENMVIGVVGDITAAELSELLDKHFSSLPEKYSPDSKVSDVVVSSVGTEQRIARDVPQTVIYFSFPGLKRNDPLYMPAFVMNYILGGAGLESRMSDALREARGLTYTVNTSLEPMRHTATITGRFDTRPDRADEAVKVMRDTIALFHDKGVSEKELRNAKQYITGTFPLSLDSNSNIAAFLTTMQIHHLGMDYLEKRNAMIQAVTLDEINTLAKKLLDPKALHVVVVGKQQEKQ